ncbi:hypothetical protein ACFE04_002945 [Oxalis oulophora]
MLAVFENAVGKPPEELRLPSIDKSEGVKTGEEVVEFFRSSWPESTIYTFSKGNFMALSRADDTPLHPRSVFVVDDIVCIFIGSLENLCELRRYYGLSRHATEAMAVVEAYKVLRDRAPYPPDQVIKDLEGKFAFILFDVKSGKLLAARDREGKIDLRWGMANDGSLVCSDSPNIMNEVCGKCYTPFPPGCIYISGRGLMSFDHPLYKVRATLHEDDGGNISGVIFQVDLLTRLLSIPRTGSGANWAETTAIEGD